MKHYPCEVCKKSVLNQHKAICCDHCNQWVHIKCNDLNDLNYNLNSKNESTGALINLMNQFNNFTDDKKENELKLPNCKYRDIDYFQKLSRNFKRKTLSFFI